MSAAQTVWLRIAKAHRVVQGRQILLINLQVDSTSQWWDSRRILTDHQINPDAGRNESLPLNLKNMMFPCEISREDRGKPSDVDGEASHSGHHHAPDC